MALTDGDGRPIGADGRPLRLIPEASAATPPGRHLHQWTPFGRPFDDAGDFAKLPTEVVVVLWCRCGEVVVKRFKVPPA